VPNSVVDTLTWTMQLEARVYASVTVCACDILGFGRLIELGTPEQVGFKIKWDITRFCGLFLHLSIVSVPVGEYCSVLSAVSTPVRSVCAKEWMLQLIK
jgi:hypothetical protein